MNAEETRKQVQRDLGVTPDGVFGPKTKEAFMSLADLQDDTSSIIRGTKGDFAVEVVGPDLWVRNVRSTCFGGSGDSMDSGDTASGYSTKNHPFLKAVSLPMNYVGTSIATRKALSGSPIPLMPFGLHADGSENRDGAWVEVIFGNGAHEIVPCIDLGPNIDRYPKNAIDCTIALAKVANPLATANNFEAVVSYRIINGAKFLS